MVKLGPIHGYKWTLATTVEQEEIESKFEDGLYDFVDVEKTEIRQWALDREDNPILVRYKFTPFFYIELPKFISQGGNVVQHPTWTETEIEMILKELRKIVPVPKYKYSQKQKMYYYLRNKTNPMILVILNNERDKNRLASELKQNSIGLCGGSLKVKLNCHEVKISTINKMLTLTNLGYSQWHYIEAQEVTVGERISDLHYTEYLADWHHIDPITSDDSKTWISHPMMVAIDIECRAKNHNQMPNRYLNSDVVWIVSVIAQRYLKPETRKHYALLFGDCNPSEVATVIKCDTEIGLIHKLEDLIHELQPQILTGYNIFGFDLPYLTARLRNEFAEWTKRMSGVPTEQPKVEVIKWKSAAYGYIENTIIDIEGIIWIDGLPLIKRDFKLPTYSLNAVSQKFLDGKSKHDVTPKEMFQIYDHLELFTTVIRQSAKKEGITLTFEEDVKTRTTYDQYIRTKCPDKVTEWEDLLENVRKVLDYAVQDSVLVLDILDKVNVWASLIQKSNVLSVDIMSTFTRGQQVTVLNQIYRLACKDDIVIDQQDPSNYPFCGGFVGTPKPGIRKGISCFDFASLYPTIIMAYNISWDTFIHPNHRHLFNPNDCIIIKVDLSSIEGDSPDEEELIEVEDLDDDEFTEVKSKPAGKGFLEVWFIKPHIKKGLLPRMVENLVNERRYVRDTIMPNYAYGSLFHGVLDKLQLALKVSANSGYGVLGVKNGAVLPLLEGSIAVTYLGRQSILRVNRILEGKEGDVLKKTADDLREKYPDIDGLLAKSEVVYNDTDSSFSYHGIDDDMNKLLDICLVIEEHINGNDPDGNPYFPPPMKLEFEKYFAIILLIKKKHYVGILASTKAEPKKGIVRGQPLWDEKAWFVRGVLIVRRDTIEFVRDLYRKVLLMGLTEKSPEECISMIYEDITKLQKGEVDLGKLIETRSVGKNYKPNSTYFMKLAGEEMKKRGHPLNPGDRIEYVIVKKPSNAPDDKLGYKIRPLDYWNSRRNTDQDEPIDYNYYLVKRCQKRVDDLFSIIYSGKTENIYPVKNFLKCGPTIAKPLLEESYDIIYI